METRRMSLPRRCQFLSLFVLGLMILPVGCGGPKAPVYRGPGHDADWPIEAPKAEAYSAFLHAKRHSQRGAVDKAIKAYQKLRLVCLGMMKTGIKLPGLEVIN